MNLDDYIKMMAREDGLEEGLKEGRRIACRELIENLLKGSEHTDAEIAGFANVNVAFVKEIRESLVIH